MSVNGSDFVDFAKECMVHENEIGFRNAIGRAYYGLYHEICGMLQSCPPTTHSGVSDYLISSSWKGERERYEKMDLISLGAILKQQHTKRKWADYDIKTNVKKSDAESCLTTVEKAMEKIKKM